MSERIVAFGDVHVPDHARQLIPKFLREVKDARPKLVVVLGDVLDVESLGHYRKDPTRHPRIASDKTFVKRFLQDVQDAARCSMVFLAGNHEDRLFKYVADNAPAIVDVWGKDLLNFKDVLPQGVRWIEPGRPFKYGSIIFVHGDGLPNNPEARLRKIGSSCVSGHSHRLSLNYSTSLTRELWSLECGCISNNPAHYSKRVRPCENWQRGYGLIEVVGGKAYPSPRSLE